jgi:2'-5' RNA ligase
MLPGDRLVCAFVEPQEVGGQFTDWLLHVTIVPWFRLDEPSKQIATGLEKALTSIEYFEAEAAEIVKFGPKKNRPARLLQLPTPFTEVEQKIRNYFHKKRAWLVDETTKKPKEFRPHVTLQKTGELAQAQTFKVHKLYIIEQKGDYRQLDKSCMSEISLSEQKFAAPERFNRSGQKPRLDSPGFYVHYKEIVAEIYLGKS